jgi:hypothetical protein
MASPDIAFENLMLAMLEAGAQAADRGDHAALSAYVDVLDVGLSEAKEHGMAFHAPELRDLDPYTLLERAKRRSA